MADEAPQLTKYNFLPFIRQGIGQLIDKTQNSFRASFDINLKFTNINDNINKSVSLYGPGDIVGIDPRFIIKTFPRHNIGDFEPNYFPYVDFWADFPWRYTPIKHNEKGQLPPWLCLIVLKAPGEENQEYDKIEKNASPLPFVIVKDIKKSLPDLSQSWAWAHVHVTLGEKEITDNLNSNIKELLRTEPERIVSRIMCLRRLEPKVLYHAFLVPVYQSGRMAGLGYSDKEITDSITINGNVEYKRLAWYDNTPNDFKLPYYYQWEFRTGYRGDFETLVRLLEPRELDSTIGKRPMECTKIGYGLQDINVQNPETDYKNVDLGLEGALKTINNKPTEWPVSTEDSEFQEKLQNLFNLPAETIAQNQESPPIIVPPIYGCWHAAIDKVNYKNYAITWIDELNLDLRNRTVAGMGTQVVQQEQEKLMAAAWKQVGAIDEANRLLRLAQLGKSVTDKIHHKYLKSSSPGDLLRSVSPLLSKVLISENQEKNGKKISIKHLIKKSNVPLVALSPSFKKIQRKGTAFYKNKLNNKQTSQLDVIERLNNKEIAAAGSPPVLIHEINNISGQLGENLKYTKGWFWKVLKKIPSVLFYLAIILIIAFALLKQFHISLPVTNTYLNSIIVFIFLLAVFISRLINKGVLSETIRNENLTPELVIKAMKNPPKDFKISSPGEYDNGASNDLSANFGEFAFAVQSYLKYQPSKTEPKELTIQELQSALLADTEPKKTFSNKINSLLQLNTNELPTRKDELDLIMAAPEFDQPMYEPLRNLSQDLLLPGLEKIPQNTVGLLLTNEKFIESYFAGLNHEFARELLWREYPTDQRGSYFRQFWDVADTIPEDNSILEAKDYITAIADKNGINYSDNQKLIEIIKYSKKLIKDIKPIHIWRNNKLKTNKNPRGLTKLGDNKNQNNCNKDENLVLLIRGDLLKKYPNALIYMTVAKWGTNENKQPIREPKLDNIKTDAKFPIFKGTLPPDITFLGFTISVEDARGSTKPDEMPGYFFIIEERVSETKFGLDEYREGDKEPDNQPGFYTYSWWHIDNAKAKTPSEYIDVTCQKLPEVEGLSWNSHSASIANITLQMPMRVAIHAEKMIK